MVDLQQSQQSNHVRVIVLNADESWDFPSLVRQRALDLYNPRFKVDFWNIDTRILDADPTARKQDRLIWGNWPRRISSFDGALAEIEDLLTDLLPDEKLAIIPVFPNLSGLDTDVDASGSVNDRLNFLRHLRDILSEAPEDQVRTWRLLAVRQTPPLEQNGTPTCALQDHSLANNLCFFGRDRRRDQEKPEAADFNFDGLRLLIDLAKSEDTGWAKLRATFGPRTPSYALWLRTQFASQNTFLTTTAFQMRRLIAHAVDQFQSTAKTRLEQEVEESLTQTTGSGGTSRSEQLAGTTGTGRSKSLYQLVKDLDEIIDQQSRQSAGDPVDLSEPLDKVFRRLPFFNHNKYSARVAALPGIITRRIDQDFYHRFDTLQDSQRHFDKQMQEKEEEILQEVHHLRGSNLGTSGEAANYLQKILAEVKAKKQARSETARHLRLDVAKSISTASRLGGRAEDDVSEEALAKPHRPHFKEDRALKQACVEAARTAAHLPRGLGLSGWTTVPMLSNAGTVFALKTEDLVGFSQKLVTFAGYDRLHAVFIWCTIIVALLGSFLAVYMQRRQLARRAHNASDQADLLATKVNSVYQNCVEYANTSRAAGWIDVVERRLELLSDQIEEARAFNRHYQHFIQMPGWAASRLTPDPARTQQFLSLFYDDTMKTKSAALWLRDFLQWDIHNKMGTIRFIIEDQVWSEQIQSVYFEEDMSLKLTPVFVRHQSLDEN